MEKMNKLIKRSFSLLLLIIFFLVLCLIPEKLTFGQQDESLKLKYVFQVDSCYVRVVNEKDNVLDFQYVKLNHPVKIKEDRALFDGYFIFETDFSPWHLGNIEVYQYEPYHWEASYNLYDSERKTLTFFLYYDSTPWIERKDAIIDEEVLFENVSLKWQVLPEVKHKEGWLIKHEDGSYILFPIRFMFELFGYNVQWVPDSREILIYSNS